MKKGLMLGACVVLMGLGLAVRATAQAPAKAPAAPAKAPAPGKAPAKAPAKASAPAKVAPAPAAAAAATKAGPRPTKAGPTKAGAPEGGEAPAVDVHEALQKLHSHDIAEIRGAIDLLGVSNSAAAARALGELLRDGAPAALVEPALDALGALGRPESEGILVEFARHRRPEVRVKATTILAGLHTPRVLHAQEEALADSDSRVRAAAGTALARSATREQMPVLIRAFDHGVVEVAPALGRLGTPAECTELLRQLGHAPLAAVLAAMREFLNRRDFPDPAKLNIVQKLLDLAGGDVKRFLRDWIATLPATDHGPVRHAAEEAMQRIAD